MVCPASERARSSTLVTLVTLVTLASLASACSSQAGAGSSSVADGGGIDAGADVGVPGGHSIRLDVTLAMEADAGGNVVFLTPAASLFAMPASDVAGKPYYVATFQGGFDVGVDLDLHHEWGIVPDDLHVSYVTPPKFHDGPYDVAFIVYTKTKITKAMKDDYFGVVPTSGELSAFSISQDRVRSGDPGFSNGVVRVDVEGADAVLSLRNHHDPKDVLGSLTDTVLTVP